MKARSRQLRNRKGQYARPHKASRLVAPVLLFASILCGGYISCSHNTLSCGQSFQSRELVSPVPYAGSVVFTGTTVYAATESASPTEASVSAEPVENIDTWIGEAVDEFLPKNKSEARMIMHCLAYRESGHGASKGHGDNGKAGGPFQFWNDTWSRMRGQMIKQGKATEVGSRYDFKEASRTTAWALANGRGGEWGPIYREMRGEDRQTCPKPSWMK